jgi:hypothetical protein
MELTGAAMAGGGEPIVSRVGRVDPAADRFEREHEGMLGRVSLFAPQSGAIVRSAVA